MTKKRSSAKELARMAARLEVTQLRQEPGEALRPLDQHTLLFEHTADGMVVADAEGRYVDANMAACNMLGYSRKELLALTIRDVLEPDEWPRIASEIARCADGNVIRSEWRFRRKDGSLFVGEITGNQLPDGGVQGILRDITTRLANEAALKVSEERIRSILESMTDGFFVLDHDWRISYINGAGERFLNRIPGDMIGKLVWEEFPGTVDSEFERVYRRVAATQVGESFTAYYPNFESWYEVTANPAADGLTVYFRDVTERLRV